MVRSVMPSPQAQAIVDVAVRNPVPQHYRRQAVFVIMGVVEDPPADGHPGAGLVAVEVVAVYLIARQADNRFVVL